MDNTTRMPPPLQMPLSAANRDTMIRPFFSTLNKMTALDMRLLAGVVTVLMAPAAIALPLTPTMSIDELFAQGQREMPSSWRGVNKAHDAAVFIHNDRRRESDGRLAVWMHRELASSAYHEKEKAYLSVRERLVVDCKAGRLGITDVAYYGERFAKGATVGSAKFKAPEMTDPVPDSIEDQVLRSLCASKGSQASTQRHKNKAQ